MLAQHSFLHLDLLILDSRNFVLRNFVGSVALILVVRELGFDRNAPSSQQTKSLIGLGLCFEFLWWDFDDFWEQFGFLRSLFLLVFSLLLLLALHCLFFFIVSLLFR